MIESTYGDRHREITREKDIDALHRIFRSAIEERAPVILPCFKLQRNLDVMALIVESLEGLTPDEKSQLELMYDVHGLEDIARIMHRTDPERYHYLEDLILDSQERLFHSVGKFKNMRD